MRQIIAATVRHLALDGPYVELNDPTSELDHEILIAPADDTSWIAVYGALAEGPDEESPLVTRDIDLLRQFAAVRVNMTITTDDETVRKAFEPTCASIERRLAAITEVQRADLPTCITLTPLLPVSDPSAFAQRLLATGVQQYVAQFFHPNRRRFVAGTREDARVLCRERQWNEAAYRRTLAVLQATLPQLAEGRDGFAPI